ncbi:ATP-binding protein [Bacillus marasmi]|uniref:ATP-binding protein n=1 Tax=Bacillus marasmi TaxID=1926279 RepID=UPI0011CB5F7B|nr:ATP-binding protein [Bacillus marasmi]
MEMAKHLLFNLSLLLVLLFFMQMWFEKNFSYNKQTKTAYMYGIIAIVLCMLFSSYLNPGVRMDLRLVPLIISGLYLGSAFLFAGVAIFVRAIIDFDSGFLVTVFLNLSVALLLLLVKPYFLKLTSKNRIVVSIMLSIIASMIFSAFVSIFTQLAYGLQIWIPYFIIAALGTGIIAYSIESMHSNMKMREQLLKSKRIEAVSQMGAAISHEIRNPLTSARGFLQFLNEGKNLDQTQRMYIEIAISELNQAEEVIGNYLTFAKPAIEKVEEVNSHWIFHQILSELSPMISNQDIKIVKKFTSKSTLVADKEMLRRCFHNLIKNNIESMPEGGNLTIQTSDHKGLVIITITDTGYGMSEEILNRLGEPFYSTTEGHGTGLGMMVAHSIIRAMNGTIEIISKPKHGTQFIVKFPNTERTRRVI